MLLSDANPDDGNDPRAGAFDTRRRRLVAVYAVVVIGVLASVAASLGWRASVREHERQSFQAAAANVSGQLDTQLRRETDFVRDARAVLTMQPALTASGFREWSAQLSGDDALDGYGALYVKLVPARELDSFEAHRNADPAFRRVVGGHVAPVARSGRPFYCLLAGGSASLRHSAELELALQGDWCDPSSPIGGYSQNGVTRAEFTTSVTDAGGFLAYAQALAGARTLIVEGAYYRRGAPLATVAERRRAVLGWVLGSFDIPTILHSALGRDDRLSVTLYHVDPGAHDRELIGRAGSSVRGAFAQTSSLAVAGTWVLRIAGKTATGPSATVQAAAVLAAGLIATALLFALVLVLARARERALVLVEEKTGQLRYQALHDPLTGLPNRVLALDRAEQMLARARRARSPVAALFVDVDGFKDVNDSFGHAAGDELLRIVAGRLASVVREADTAARLGGDEFVVLLEGASLDAGPEQVTERLLEALRQPYDMRSQIGRELSLTASIGIAYGVRAHADELLRDADMALYAAKAAGRNRHVLFQSSMQSALDGRRPEHADAAAGGSTGAQSTGR